MTGHHNITYLASYGCTLRMPNSPDLTQRKLNKITNTVSDITEIISLSVQMYRNEGTVFSRLIYSMHVCVVDICTMYTFWSFNR